MATVHFAYTIPPLKKTRFLSYYDYLAKKTHLFPPFFRYGAVDWPRPIRAPQSITYHLLKALQKVAKVRLYDWGENTVCDMKSGDIFLGHPKPDTSQFPWVEPDRKTVAYRTIKKCPKDRNFIISPYNHDLQQVGWSKEIFEHADNFIAICDKYWIETWSDSPLREYVKNLYRVNMAVDVDDYPQVKFSFSPKGKRKYLYVGRTEHPKNIEELERIAASSKNFIGGYISNGSIKGWHKIANYADLTPSFMSKLAKEYDIFLHTSEFDAQATVVLEMMLFGFAVACTKESGISYQSVTRLDIKDTQFNCRQLEALQAADETELLELSRMNRDNVLKNHNWDEFCNSVLSAMRIN